MKKFMRLSAALSVLIFVSCGGGGGEGTSNFGSKTEADAALAQSQAQITLAVNDVKNVASVAGSWGSAKPLAWTYDAGTGWWSNVYSSSGGGYTYNYDYRHRFTPRDANGYATEATDKMEYGYEYSYDGSSAGYSYILEYISDIECTGISGYRASTDNLTVNGSSDIDYDFDFSYGETDYSYEYEYHTTYKNVEFTHGTAYPVGGSITFTTRFKLTPAVQGVDNYYVSGKITFTGGNTATLEFGGYTYTINLVTGVIS